MNMSKNSSSSVFQIRHCNCWHIDTLCRIQTRMLFYRIIMWLWLKTSFLLCWPMINNAIRLEIFDATPFFSDMQTRIKDLDSLLQKSALNLFIWESKCSTMAFIKGTVMRISKMCMILWHSTITSLFVNIQCQILK